MCGDTRIPQLGNELAGPGADHDRFVAMSQIRNNVVKLPLAAADVAAARKVQNSLNLKFPQIASCRRLKFSN